jgi:hypothetical protein
LPLASKLFCFGTSQKIPITVTTMLFMHHRVVNTVFESQMKAPKLFCGGRPASNSAFTPFVVWSLSPGREPSRATRYLLRSVGTIVLKCKCPEMLNFLSHSAKRHSFVLTILPHPKGWISRCAEEPASTTTLAYARRLMTKGQISWETDEWYGNFGMLID